MAALFQGHSVRAASAGGIAVAATGSGKTVDRRARRAAVRRECAQNPMWGMPKVVNEDCLYVNVWTPALPPTSLETGDGVDSRWRQCRGIGQGKRREPDRGMEWCWYDFNYRLAVFGFFAHPELTAEIAGPRLRQLRADGPDRGAAMGAGEHQEVRWRSGERHDLWRVSRRDGCESADDVPVWPRACFIG